MSALCARVGCGLMIVQDADGRWLHVEGDDVGGAGPDHHDARPPLHIQETDEEVVVTVPAEGRVVSRRTKVEVRVKYKPVGVEQNVFGRFEFNTNAHNPTMGVSSLGGRLHPALCESCGALVGDTDTHTAFHKKIGY